MSEQQELAPKRPPAHWERVPGHPVHERDGIETWEYSGFRVTSQLADMDAPTPPRSPPIPTWPVVISRRGRRATDDEVSGRRPPRADATSTTEGEIGGKEGAGATGLPGDSHTPVEPGPRKPAPAPDEPEPPYMVDDDEGTDLTDLVDVPEPPASLVAAAAPALVTPPPPPRQLVHLPLIDDDGGPLLPPEDYDRPRTRGDCESMPRPCPFISCRHHIYPEIMAASSNNAHADSEPWQLPQTCALDVADQGGATLEEVGEILGVTRERIRQLEAKALRRLKILSRRRRWDFEAFQDRETGAPEDVAPYNNARGAGAE